MSLFPQCHSCNLSLIAEPSPSGKTTSRRAFAWLCENVHDCSFSRSLSSSDLFSLSRLVEARSGINTRQDPLISRAVSYWQWSEFTDKQTACSPGGFVISLWALSCFFFIWYFISQRTSFVIHVTLSWSISPLTRLLTLFEFNLVLTLSWQIFWFYFPTVR